MKRKVKFWTITFLMIIITQGFVGCVDSFNQCPEPTKWVRVYNKHQDPYRLLINDLFIAIIPPEDNIIHDIDYGYYNFKLIQESGYDSIPEIFEDFLNIDSCTLNEWGP